MVFRLDKTNTDFDAAFARLLTMKREQDEDVNLAVGDIINEVRERGDAALCDYTKRFDRNGMTPDMLRVSPEEIDRAEADCPHETLQALDVATKRIADFHARQKPQDERFTDAQGVELGHRWTAVSAAGIYVPGGLANYPSSVLMNALPAKVAGVDRLVMVVPMPEGKVNPLVLAAAKRAGVNEIYKVGGAQAVAALTFGTESIQRVDKVVGPGNSFVTEAKKQLYGYVGIDSIAGPSEILVIADKHNNPKWVAMDLLSQAEHDEEARAILISNSKDFIIKVNRYLLNFLKSINRTKIATKSIKKNGLAILIKDINYAHCIANYIAPEHLEIMTKNKKFLAKKIINAGAIFMGEYTPEAFGDYIAGPSHVLPTSGNARFDSGLSVLDFLKRTSYIEANKTGLKNTLHSIETLGNSEGLDAHVKSAKIRFSKD